MKILGIVLACSVMGQDPSKPVLTAGVSVQMATAHNAVAMPAADELDVKVVAITATGKVFYGVTAVEPEALRGLGAIYVKADARAPFQRVLAVLEALRGKQIVLLTAPPSNSSKGMIVPPYGIRLTMPE